MVPIRTGQGQPSNPLTLSPSHPLTLSPSHPLTLTLTLTLALTLTLTLTPNPNPNPNPNPSPNPNPNSAAFTYYAPPRVLSTWPRAGADTGGTNVSSAADGLTL